MKSFPPSAFRLPPSSSPLEQVRALYAKHGLDFQADLEDHLRYGFVVALPNCFAMATAIKLDGKETDAWFVKAAAGDLQLLVRLIPVPLPFIAFCRGPGLPMKVYARARLKARVLHSQPSTLNHQLPAASA